MEQEVHNYFTRNDLNYCHLLARGGLVDSQYNKELLLQPNKNGWLPVHLAKNKATAQWLYQDSLNQGLTKHDIIYKALLNNAESMQTKYGSDLIQVFQEHGFNPKNSLKAGKPPTFEQRVELSYFWLNLAELTQIDIERIFKIAITNSNSPFFLALSKINSNPAIISAIHDVSVGESFYISDRAFQLQQILRLKFAKNIAITTRHTELSNTDNHSLLELPNGQALKNLEGF